LIETPEPPMRIAHGIFALGVIAIFLALHLANHLTSTEEQEEAVARLGVVGTCQRGVLVGAPLVETE
jgi:hypothetical protein